jgi:hypothetical protein
MGCDLHDMDVLYCGNGNEATKMYMGCVNVFDIDVLYENEAKLIRSDPITISIASSRVLRGP